MDINIKVTSPSFSKSETLAGELRSKFSNINLNNKGEKYNERELIEYLKDADGAIIGLESMTSFVLSNLPKLKIISKYGVGLDGIDLNYCHDNNIKVGWTGGVNKRSAAELALCFMLGLSRNVFNTACKLKNDGMWDKNGGFQLTGKTVGIIGVGNVGKELAKLLEPFHCKVLANDIVEQSQYYSENGIESASKDRIFSEADIITLHTPYTKDTEYLVNSESLSKMKKSSYLVNVARGELVDQKSLKVALKSNLIAGAAIDVYESEPPTDFELLKMHNLFCTPHIGGNAEEAILSMGRSAIYHLNEFFQINVEKEL